MSKDWTGIITRHGKQSSGIFRIGRPVRKLKNLRGMTMNKEQQIEEMMQVIFDYVDSKGMKNVYIVGNAFANDMKSYFYNFEVAEALYKAGYRKVASEKSLIEAKKVNEK